MALCHFEIKGGLRPLRPPSPASYFSSNNSAACLLFVKNQLFVYIFHHNQISGLKIEFCPSVQEKMDGRLLHV